MHTTTTTTTTKRLTFSNTAPFPSSFVLFFSLFSLSLSLSLSLFFFFQNWLCSRDSAWLASMLRSWRRGRMLACWTCSHLQPRVQPRPSMTMMWHTRAPAPRSNGAPAHKSEPSHDFPTNIFGELDGMVVKKGRVDEEGGKREGGGVRVRE